MKRLSDEELEQVEQSYTSDERVRSLVSEVRERRVDVDDEFPEDYEPYEPVYLPDLWKKPSLRDSSWFYDSARVLLAGLEPGDTVDFNRDEFSCFLVGDAYDPKPTDRELSCVPEQAVLVEPKTIPIKIERNRLLTPPITFEVPQRSTGKATQALVVLRKGRPFLYAGLFHKPVIVYAASFVTVNFSDMVLFEL